MKFVSDKVIYLDRELSDLDLFALDFIRILRKHTNYAIVSGYVSILLGRSRASEDVDILIPKLDFSRFVSLLKDLRKNGFYCLNAEEDNDIYEHIKDNIPVRFAKTGRIIPNTELKCKKNNIDQLTLNNTITIRLQKEEIIVSNLEMNIAFKEIVLKSPKDMEDAKHLRGVAKGHLNEKLIKDYGRMLNEIY